ncbi:MAG: methyltransferase domain-containing protein [Candidatus Eisenbacteria bacterium]|uniref:Methyltransferase domain-containing protein n=1 Tax=Eiseniibacteriota bacterium TaxID=2212470 RepID=A0A956SE44_UNCEI|nr:methyltransferase domain-containing protein [Candidatus Eisenbacteria bacterium]
MKHRHFEELQPVCPSCKMHGLGMFELEVGWVGRETVDGIAEGGLYCTNPECRAEFPIIDGLPVIVPDARAFLADNVFQFLIRDDLDGRIEALLGECSGPGSAYDTIRVQIGSYAWDHYAEFAGTSGTSGAPGTSAASATSATSATPNSSIPGSEGSGSLRRAFHHLEALVPEPPTGPVLEIGCSVGGLTLEAGARSDDLVLGIDLNVPMIRIAKRALDTGVARFPVRKSGLVYDHREVPHPFGPCDNVDFWIADAHVLPFRGDRFARSLALNVLDSTMSPLDVLRSLVEVTRPGGLLYLTTPYDWSGAVTPPEAWLGGHSPRAPGGGDPAWVLRSLLTPGAHPASLESTSIVGERDSLPWTVRMHERSRSEYAMHGVVVRVDGSN